MFEIEKGQAFTETYIVTERVYNGFIDVYDDKNPLHTDLDFAINKGFDGCVMFGNILNGFLSNFIGERLPMKNVIIHSQHIKFLKPVYLDDQLLLKIHVKDIVESVNVVKFDFYFEKNV